MILRLVVLMASGGLAYAMLRGWPDALPDLPRACLAVLLLVGGLGWWAFGRKSEELPVVKGARKPGWLDFCLIGTGLLALECGFLWILSAAPEPLEEIAIPIEERFRPAAAEERKRNGNGTAGPGGGNWLWEEEGRRELPRRTNLKLGVKPEVFVRIVDGEDAEELLKRQLYVRAFALERFEDGVWSPAGRDETLLEAGTDGWIRFDEGAGEGILHEVFHGKDPGGRDVFTAIQGARAVRLPSLKVTAGGISLLPAPGGPAGYEYLASSVPVRLADLKGKEIETVRAAVEGTVSRIRKLTLKAAGEGDLVEKLINIENYLRDNYDYSLVTRNTRNLEPMENFLFEERRGHCEFFATAGALMAKELGLEARVAYGWAGGQFFKANNMFVLRAREAHSWVEVKLDGYGWVLMEPTPPAALGGGGAPRVAAEDEEFPEPEEVLADDDEEVDPGSADVPAVALGLAGAFALGAGLLVFLREKSRPEAGGRMIAGGRQAAGYFAAWRRAGRSKGVRESGRTLKRQVEELEETPAFAGELLRYHYGVRYEQLPTDRELEDRLEREIREWGG